MKARQDAARLGIVVYEGVEPIDIGGTFGVVSMARRVLPALEAVVIAERAGPVTLASGLVVMAEAGFETAPPCDYMIVTGGPGWRNEVKNPAMLAFLQALAGKPVASVCTGALILAAAGLVDGKRVTTRRHAVGAETRAPLDLLADYAKGHQPMPALVVDDGVITGGGVSLAIDATLYLIGKLYGGPAADEVAAVIEYDRAYAANRAALGLVA